MKKSNKLLKASRLREESGQILAYVIVLLAIVSIILAPLLNFMSSGLTQGTSLEMRSVQYSGADAGVQSAWQMLKEGKDLHTELPTSPTDLPYTYQIVSGSLTVNVTITLTGSDLVNKTKTYNVNSTCSDSRGGTTSISATLRASPAAYAYFMDNVFSTLVQIYLKNGVTLNGFTQSAGFSFKQPVWGLNPNPPPQYYGDRGELPTGWPSAEQLRTYYQNLDPNYHTGTWTIPDGYHFTKTEYVEGNCEINEIYLDGQTLFVDGSFLNPPNKSVTIHGPGAVVATNNITFGPKMTIGDPANGVLLVALGTADLWPSSDFYGWIAAAIAILSKQGSGPTYNWLPPDYNILFPNLKGSGDDGSGAGSLAVLSWDTTLS
jgi:hypothetical protein